VSFDSLVDSAPLVEAAEEKEFLAKYPEYEEYKKKTWF
jgi:hypothetical protein